MPSRSLGPLALAVGLLTLLPAIPCRAQLVSTTTSETGELHVAPEAKGEADIRVLESFSQGNTSRVILQSNQPLVTGVNVYVGPNELPMTLGDLLAKSGVLFYYSASAPGKLKAEKGDIVRLMPVKRKLSVPDVLTFNVRQDLTFAEKYRAEITAVQGDRAMIDKGTLHEIHERDLYEIRDASGAYKGLLEIKGIGDLQSSGRLFNRLEDVRRRAREARPGDRAVFIGQRRLLGLGFVAGTTFRRTSLFYAFEKPPLGGGVAWNVTFHSGWGVEALFGYFQRSGFDGTTFEYGLAGIPMRYAQDERHVRFIAPVWLKRNFFYPSLMSPFVAAGMSGFQGKHYHEQWYKQSGSSLPAYSEGAETAEKMGIVPVVGAGIELLPLRFFRPRLEVRRFLGPRLMARGYAFDTDTTFYSFGIVTAW